MTRWKNRAYMLGALAALYFTGAMACGKSGGTAATTTSGSSSSGGGGGSGSGGGGGGSGNGTVAVAITDDPYPYYVFDRISIKVSKIEIKDSSGNYTTIEDWGATPGSFEVLGLMNGRVTQMAAKSVPAVTYTAVRLTIPRASAFTIDGSEHDSNAPMNGVVELPVSFAPQGQDVGIIFDLNLEKSLAVQASVAPILSAESVSGVAFAPVGRAAVVGSGGAIQGTVLDPNMFNAPGATVRCLAADGSIFATTATDANGGFAFIELPAGTYTLEAEWTFGTPANVPGVVITQGQTASAEILLGPPTSSQLGVK
jgi:hypothetical protein